MTRAIARDPIYRRRRFQSEIIELCVRCYLTYRLSYRDLVEMMAKRGVTASHSTIRLREKASSPTCAEKTTPSHDSGSVKSRHDHPRRPESGSSHRLEIFWTVLTPVSGERMVLAITGFSDQAEEGTCILSREPRPSRI
jgi:hypothetical protein